MSIKLLLKKYIPSSLRSKLKKTKRRLNNSLKGNVLKTTISDMRSLLINDFGIKKGDNLIISSSFGNLNADFSPHELVELLQEIVGKEGNIVMPFYPPGNSYEWAASGKVFDMQTTPSSMGVLTQIFSEMQNVYKSMHPIKAVVAWGAKAKEIVAGHEDSETPYYWDSPYGWLIKNPSKSLSLGLNHIPIFHSIEDVILENRVQILYQNGKTTLPLKTKSGEVRIISTFIHDFLKTSKLMNPRDYVKTISLQTYLKKPFGFSFCYIVDNQELFERCEIEFNNGNFRYKK